MRGIRTILMLPAIALVGLGTLWVCQSFFDLYRENKSVTAENASLKPQLIALQGDKQGLTAQVEDLTRQLEQERQGTVDAVQRAQVATVELDACRVTNVQLQSELDKSATVPPPPASKIVDPEADGSAQLSLMSVAVEMPDFSRNQLLIAILAAAIVVGYVRLIALILGRSRSGR